MRILADQDSRYDSRPASRDKSETAGPNILEPIASNT